MEGTSHAVRLDVKGDNWYHWSQCAVGKPPARTLDDIRTDLALVKAVDPGGAISGSEDEDREDVSPAVDPGGAISGSEDEDREDVSPEVDPEAAISGPEEEEDRDYSPASTRRPPSAGQGRTIRPHLSAGWGGEDMANQDGTGNSISH